MSAPECPQNAPFIVKEAESGSRWWCACGRSKMQPYCDGSHEGSDFEPIEVEVEAGQKVAWCGCKKSGSPPVCDGSHARG